MKSVVRSLYRRFIPVRSQRQNRRPMRRPLLRPRLNVLEDRNMLAALIVSHVEVQEHSGSAVFSVAVAGAQSETVTVDYSITSGSATVGNDVSAASGALTFQPGDSAQLIIVAITDDSVTEDDEDFYLELANAVNATIQNSGRCLILANDRAPILDPIGDRTVDEETELSFTASAQDPDTPAETLTFSLDSGAPSGACIDPDTGAFSWTPTEADGPGTFSVTIRVTEGGALALSDTETITITVLEVNRAPEASSIANVSVNEDAAPTTFNVYGTFEDPEDTDFQMTYAVAGNTNPAMFSSVTIDGTTGNLTLAYALNANGSASITVRATDTGGLSVDTTFEVTVAAVNDAPVISGFQVITEGGDWWCFEGVVTDVDDDVTGWTVTFGGIVSGTYTATVYSDGTFILVDRMPGMTTGIATAITTDPQGEDSNLAEFFVVA
jgi:hypothetical protein